MTDEIKEKLEKEMELDNQDLLKNGLNRAADIAIMNDNQMKVLNREILKAKLTQHEETKSSLINQIKEMIEKPLSVWKEVLKQADNKDKKDGVEAIIIQLQDFIKKLSEMEKQT